MIKDYSFLAELFINIQVLSTDISVTRETLESEQQTTVILHTHSHKQRLLFMIDYSCPKVRLNH